MSHEHVLFADKVFSLNPSDDAFTGYDPLSFLINNQHPDEEIYPSLTDENGIPHKIGLPGAVIFLFDEQETWVRNQHLKMIAKRQLNLKLAREVIADEHYPVHVEYTRKFKRWTAKRKTMEMLGEFSIIFGRACLVDMIASCRYFQAWPEIREIILHDDSRRMKFAAKIALKTFPKNIAVPVLVDVLESDIEEFMVMSFVDVAELYSSESLVRPLEKIFEKNFYYYPESHAEIYYGYTHQDDIINACVNIPTLSALSLIEKGITHPYSHVQLNARKAFKKWSQNTAQEIGLQEYSSENQILNSAIKKFMWKYDLEPNNRRAKHYFSKETILL